MDNEFFFDWEDDGEPLYDLCLISDKESRYWHNPTCNYSNNSRSVTKFFMALGIAILRDDGKLKLDDKVVSFFDENELPDVMDEKWRDVTVEQTLQHKTGIEIVPYGVDEPDARAVLRNDFLKYVFSLPVMHTPGEFYKYSDAAYYLLSRIIAKASGKTADNFLRERVMAPMCFGEIAFGVCPEGHPIGGDGLFASARDIAKTAYMFACGGVYEGKRYVSEKWIDLAKKNDYALTRFRDTDVFVKTGACGQIVAFSTQARTGVAWHSYSSHGNARNDAMLEAFVRYIDAHKE